jgi:diguanylate cyclase (GGDEF)-like protein
MRVRDDSFLDLQGASPLKPLVGFALLAACAFAAHPQGSDWRWVSLAGVIFALGAALAHLGARSSGLAALVPAMAALAAVGALRESQGGAASGYSPLAILAVIWVAVMLDRRALLLVGACMGLTLSLPILLVGGPAYPSTGWRGAILLTIVGLIVGEIANRSVSHVRRQVVEAQERSEELEEMQRAFGAILRVSREVALGNDARELVCIAALAGLDATVATIVEPREDGFRITGSAGLTLGRQEVGRVEPIASVQAFQTSERVFVPDARRDPRVTQSIVEAAGLASIVFEPIVREAGAVGVLAVGWRTPRSCFDAKTEAIIRFLAAEAGAAIERADLIAQLDGQARSDALTGLPNRRAWDDAIAMAMRETTNSCVAMVDLDHFKHFNDEYGHAAGDELLVACAEAWSGVLRSQDTLARIGGEEFAVLLPRCSLAQAKEVLERLRHATPPVVTASVGVAKTQAAESATQVLARADAALYEAKGSGRDQLCAA